MRAEVYRDGVLVERQDDATRTVTTWPGGTTRPYTPDENAAADLRDASEAESVRETTLRDALTAGIAGAVARRQAIDAAADALAAEVAALGSVSLAAVKSLGNRVVTLARATANGDRDTIALARLAVRALDSTTT